MFYGSFLVVFFAIIIGMTVYSDKTSKKETVINVKRGSELWNKVDEWAKSEGFDLKADDNNVKLYQKGKNIISSPCFVKVEEKSDEVILTGWMFVNYYVVSAKIAFDDPGFMGKAIRIKRMKALQKLESAIQG